MAEKRELQLLLGLWTITLCYPLIDGWVMINESTTGILYYFTRYSGYFVLGFYLKKYPDSLSLALSVLTAVNGVMLLLLLKRYEIEFDFYQFFWYLSIFIVSLAVVIWKTAVVVYNWLNCCDIIEEGFAPFQYYLRNLPDSYPDNEFLAMASALD